jgi:hypothetical protein
MDRQLVSGWYLQHTNGIKKKKKNQLDCQMNDNEQRSQPLDVVLGSSPLREQCLPCPFHLQPCHHHSSHGRTLTTTTTTTKNNNNGNKKIVACVNFIFHANLGGLKVDLRALGYELLEGSDEKHGPMVSQHLRLRALQ